MTTESTLTDPASDVARAEAAPAGAPAPRPASGSNAKHLAFESNPDVTVIDNQDGIVGGVHAWRD